MRICSTLLFLYGACFLGLSSCAPSTSPSTEKQIFAEEVSIEQDINLQNHESALIRINNLKEYLASKGLKNERLDFLEASIYASLGNINIFTLYPLLEMYLFNAPALDWEKMKEKRNPYTKYIDKYYGEEGEDRTREEEDQKYSSKRNLTSSMTMLWTLYEIIPNINLLPHINNADEKYAQKAISILNKTLTYADYRNRSYLYRSLIAGIIMLNILQEVFPLIDADPLATLCHARINLFYNKSETLYKMLFYLLEGYAETSQNQERKIKLKKDLEQLTANPHFFMTKENLKNMRNMQTVYCSKLFMEQ